MPLIPRLISAAAAFRGGPAPIRNDSATPSVASPASPEPEMRVDGWVNTTSGLGVTGKDKAVGVEFCPSTPIQRYTLSQLYRFDGVASTIIDRPVWDSVRRGYSIDSDDVEGDELAELLDALEASGAYAMARKWARLYGNALIIAGTDDVAEGDLSTPLGSYGEVRWFEVVAAGYGGPVYENREDATDPLAITSYTINPSGKRTTTTVVHASRVYRVAGVPLPDEISLENTCWDDSVIQRVFTALSRVATADATGANFLSERQYPIWRIDGLAQALASEQTSGATTARFQAMAVAKSIYKAIILDRGREDFEVVEAGVGGLAEMLNIFPSRVSAVSNIPVTILYGISPGGLNATGESDFRGYYDFVEGSEQAIHYRPFLQWATKLLMGATQGPTRGAQVPFSVAFNPLLTPSSREVADERAVIANTDSVYIREGVLAPDEVRESRYGGVEYSAQTTLDETSARDTGEMT